jgi:hypothetical protein
LSVCEIQAVSRAPLRLEDGREVYVEPQALASDGGTILLAGRPTYVWTRDSLGVSRPEEDDESIGVVLEGQVATLINTPVRAPLLDDVRVLPLRAGRWAILMSELDADSRFPERDGAIHLWYAEYDAPGWTTVEEVPLPAAGRLQTFSSSKLVRVEDGVGWLGQVVSTDGSGRVLFFRRSAGGWSTEVVSPTRSDALALGSSQATGLVAALAGAEEGVGGWIYSLRTLRRDSAWTGESRVVVASENEVIRRPWLSSAGGLSTLSWIVEPRAQTGSAPGAWATTESRVGLFGKAETVDHGSPRVVPVPVGDSAFLWIADHDDGLTGEPELRFIRRTPTGPLVMGVLPNPFTGYFSATWTDPELIIIGPEFNPSPGEPTVRSLIVRVTLSC